MSIIAYFFLGKNSILCLLDAIEDSKKLVVFINLREKRKIGVDAEKIMV
jgi:hypothetical protein